MPLENTIRDPTWQFPDQKTGPHSICDDPSMSLSTVTALIGNLIAVPAAVLRGRVAKEAEVLALRQENVVLRRQIARVRYECADRIWLAALSRLVSRERWRQAFAVTSTTLLAWYRQLIARKWTFTRHRRPGRPSDSAITVKASATSHKTRDLILLAVGVLLACAAAFYLGMRLTNHRRTRDDGGDQQALDPKQGVLAAGVGDGGLDVDHQKVNTAAPQPLEHGGRKTSHDSTGRRVKAGRNLVLGHHMLNQADHRAAGMRACGGADSNSQPPGLSQGEDVNAVIHEEPNTAYVRQA
ncbi:hypothetical protein ACWFR5_12180 [Streptomyces sp. NPDC055092]